MSFIDLNGFHWVVGESSLPHIPGGNVSLFREKKALT